MSSPADGSETTFDHVYAPSQDARREALAYHEQLVKPSGSLGRLEELGAWIAACQDRCPPEPFRNPRVVIFAGDHGIANLGVSAFPGEVTGQLVRAALAGGTAVNVLAASAGAGLRIADISVSTDTDERVSEHKVRRGSGSIDMTDALSEDEVRAALYVGKSIADEEVDGGADLLIAGDIGVGNSTPAAVIVAALTNTEPVAVVGRGSGIDDAAWMRKATAIRDARLRARRSMDNPVQLLRAAGGADIAAMAAFLAQAALRRTPVLLDGLVSAAAAMVAQKLAPGAQDWWIAGHRGTEPAHRIALDHLELDPLLDLDIALGQGVGALTALPLVSAAARALAEMASYADAGVTRPAHPAAEQHTLSATEA